MKRNFRLSNSFCSLNPFVYHTLLCLCALSASASAAGAANVRSQPGLEMIKNMGGEFNQGYTLNPIEFLNIGQKWTGGNEGLANLKDIAQLHHLHLYCTELNEEGLKYLAGLPDLQALSIDKMKINASGWKHISAIHSLQALILGGESIGAIQLLSMDKLQSLSIRGLTKLQTIEICCQPQLHTLEIEWTPQLQKLDIRQLPQLKSLSIHNDISVIQSVIDIRLGTLPKLEDLSLSVSAISGLQLPDTLKSLTLWNTLVPESTLKDFGLLKNLENLRLCSSQITDGHFALFKNCRKMRTLELSCNKFQNS